LLIEQVTGLPLAEAVRRDLIEPSGVERVWVQDGEAPRDPLTVGEARGSRARLIDPAGPYLPSRAIASAAGGAGSVAGDAPTLARWGYLLYGGHVLPPEVVEQMTAGAEADGYGLGTAVGRIDGDLMIGHGGDLPGYHGVLYVWPDAETSVAVLVPNSLHSHIGSGGDASALAIQLNSAAQR
jgi:D-alanyl-D-alanine carboxypeptidase